MSWEEFWVILVGCSLTILACRVLPMFLLKDRELPQWAMQALGLIPAAAFAALVANDLLEPGMFDEGAWPAAIPLLVACIVVIVARKTRSLLWSAVTGVAVYALLALIC
ncbi:AzlD domain-containing protein [Adlercreutzia murintestinalis]|uniref:AzlD domain-containing protein n=1 Tax=Adlercreutzia murintestinalis TaxID=2941325 RepID=UPI002041566C|nr:AzlD domain-containing protein [Adlercreutzia murintestinalis]